MGGESLFKVFFIGFNHVTLNQLLELSSFLAISGKVASVLCV